MLSTRFLIVYSQMDTCPRVKQRTNGRVSKSTIGVVDGKVCQVQVKPDFLIRRDLNLTTVFEGMVNNVGEIWAPVMDFRSLNLWDVVYAYYRICRC